MFNIPTERIKERVPSKEDIDPAWFKIKNVHGRNAGYPAPVQVGSKTGAVQIKPVFQSEDFHRLSLSLNTSLK